MKPMTLAITLSATSAWKGSVKSAANLPSTTFDDTTDGTGIPGSGSARNASTFSGNTIALAQCIAVVPGTYTLGAKMFIPSGQTVTGIAVVGVTWADGPCLSSSSAILGS